MMGRPEDPAEKDDGRCKIGYDQGSPRRGQAHANEKQGNDSDSEKFKNTLHPNVDHKPSPIVCHGEVRPSAIQESKSKETHNRNRTEDVEGNKGTELTF